ncbi:hypothetical protein [Isoptericola sp. NPDC057391]|uniref:hypothetical protein n=1 Tax=Isoptericola sp. NPDC057391 TaxID=3346117 RepID=UPI003624EB91
MIQDVVDPWGPDVMPERARRSERGGGGRAGALVFLALVFGIPAVIAYVAFTPQSGQRLARSLNGDVIDGIADDIQDVQGEVQDAESVAQGAVAHPRSPHDVVGTSYDVVPLAWEGRTDDDSGAQVDLAVTVHVAHQDGVAVFDAGRSSGSRTTCVRLVVHQFDPDGIADHDRIDCPEPIAAATPQPTPVASRRAHLETGVLEVLDALPDSAPPPDVGPAVWAALGDDAAVDAERHEKELVIAVQVLGTRDCVVAVRSDGEAAWRFTDFDRILLEPGELGCDADLYLRPVTTH